MSFAFVIINWDTAVGCFEALATTGRIVFNHIYKIIMITFMVYAPTPNTFFMVKVFNFHDFVMTPIISMSQNFTDIFFPLWWPKPTLETLFYQADADFCTGHTNIGSCEVLYSV